MPSGIYKRIKPPWNKDKKGYTNKGSFRKGQIGKESGHWKGGKIIDKNGYVLIYKPEHPFCNGRGYVLRSHLIVEKIIGRFLKSPELVHHRNEIRDDDRIENLMAFKNLGYHWAFHRWSHYSQKGIIFDGRKL